MFLERKVIEQNSWYSTKHQYRTNMEVKVEEYKNFIENMKSTDFQ